jgi:hypothetical protein
LRETSCYGNPGLTDPRGRGGAHPKNVMEHHLQDRSTALHRCGAIRIINGG